MSTTIISCRLVTRACPGVGLWRRQRAFSTTTRRLSTRPNTANDARESARERYILCEGWLRGRGIDGRKLSGLTVGRALASTATDDSDAGYVLPFLSLLCVAGAGATLCAEVEVVEDEELDLDEDDRYSREVRMRREKRSKDDIEKLKDKWRWYFQGKDLRSLDPYNKTEVIVFSGSSHPLLTEEVCDYLNLPVGKSRVKRFTDGEVLVEIDQEVRGRDCFVIVPTNSNDNVVELLLCISALRRASAKHIVAVIPYFGYARQDQRAPFRRESIAAADIARMLEEVGVDRVVSVDLHTGQIQGFFSPRVPVDHLTPGAVAAAYFVEQLPEFRRAAYRRTSTSRGFTGIVAPPKVLVTVVAPHEGQVRRARIFRERLAKLLGPEAHITLAMVSKFRDDEGQVVRQLVGDVRGRTCILVDDLLDTGKTLATTSELLKDEGAHEVYAFATHARLSEGCVQRVRECRALEYVVVTNTMPVKDEGAPATSKVRQLSIAPLIAEAIINIHDSGSVSSVITSADESAPMRDKPPSDA